MEINNIGFEYCHNSTPEVNRPSGSGDYLFLLFKSDTAVLINGRTETAEPDSFIIFSVGTPQRYHASGNEFINDWFHFSMNNKDFEWLIKLNIPFDAVTKLEDSENLSLMIKDMCREKNSDTHHKSEILEHYIRLFFLKLSELLHVRPAYPSVSLQDKLNLVRNRIFSSPQKEWKVELLAQELSMSRSYFEHKYSELFGISIINEVINARLEHAKYLLRETDLTVNGIAEACGYNSNTHFMRQFSSRVHLTPSEYRSAHSHPPDSSPRDLQL